MNFTWLYIMQGHTASCYIEELLIYEIEDKTRIDPRKHKFYKMKEVL